MTYSIYVRSAAERDLAEAQQWYEQQQAGLATEFNAVLDRLADTPFVYPQR